MMKNNYLIDFIQKLDFLISEINKLDAKIRLYRRNSSKFGFEFDVKFFISPVYFEKLRNYIHEKIEQGSPYDRDVVNLKREMFKNYMCLMMRIKQEIARIDSVQEKEMNQIVYKAIYDAKLNYERKSLNSYNIESSLIEKFLGISRYRKLKIRNHELRIKLLEREYELKRREKKNVFELVSMIENTDINTGALLCLQDDMIKNFMIDRNTVKRNAEYLWKTANILPYGFFEKKAYYKILNQALIKENDNLEKELSNTKISENLKDKQFKSNNLLSLNAKLSKILKAGVVLNQ